MMENESTALSAFFAPPTPTSYLSASVSTKSPRSGLMVNDFHVRKQRKPHVDTSGNDCVVRAAQRASLGPVIVVVEQLDGVAPFNADHLIAKVALLVDLVKGHGTNETQRHNGDWVHFHSDCTLQANSGLRSVADTRHSCMSVLGGRLPVACLDSCHQARLVRAAPTTAPSRSDPAPERRTPAWSASLRCRARAACRSRRARRAARRRTPSLVSAKTQMERRSFEVPSLLHFQQAALRGSQLLPPTACIRVHLNHLDLQSIFGDIVVYLQEGHGYSCRSSALVLKFSLR